MKYRFGIVIFILIFSAFGYSQELPKKLKYDSIIYSGDSSFVAIYKGKKAGIYNLQKNRFELKMAKQEIVYSPILDYFTVFTNTDYKSYKTGNTEILEPFNFYGLLVGDAKYELSEYDENRVILKNVACPFKGLAHKEDFSFDYEHPYSGSGLYNLKTRKWEIPRKYVDIFEVGMAMFALRHDSTEFVMDGDLRSLPIFKGGYDIYTRNQKGHWELLIEGVQSMRDLPIAAVFRYREINEQPGIRNHWRCKRSPNEETFDHVIFDLFDYQNGWIPEVHFEMVRPFTDFNVVNNEENYIISYSKRDTIPLKLFGYDEYKTIDDSTLIDLVWSADRELVLYSDNFNTAKIRCDGKDEAVGSMSSKTPKNLKFGMELLNEDLIKVYDAGYDGFLHVDTDTFDSYMQYIMEPQGSYSRSGVFDLKSNNWEIEPYQANCFFGRRYKALAHFEHLSKYHGEYSEIYTVFDENDDVILDNVEKDTFYRFPFLIQDFYREQDFDTLYACRNPNPIDRLPHFYFHKDDTMGVLRIANYSEFDNYLTFAKGEFAYTNFEVGFDMIVNGNNINVYLEGSKIWAKKSEGIKLLFRYDAYKNTVYYEDEPPVTYSILHAFEVNGHSSLDHGDYEYIETPNASTAAYVSTSIQIDQNGRIVLTDSVADSYTTQGIYTDGPNDRYTVEVEGSAVWEKIDSVWTKVTPYYAWISTFKGGYICKTGSVILQSETQTDSTFNDYVDPRFLILDNDLKPVSFIDFYDFPLIEDLGFGLKICTDKGCMFVTYDLKAITDDNWTDFKLMEDGRLMAIGKKNVKHDPENPEVNDGVVGYFKIPPTE